MLNKVKSRLAGKTKIILFLILILFLTSSLAQNPNYSFPYGYTKNAYVSRVVDGDTFVLSDSQRVRILGIDCPEIARLNKLKNLLQTKLLIKPNY